MATVSVPCSTRWDTPSWKLHVVLFTFGTALSLRLRWASLIMQENTEHRSSASQRRQTGRQADRQADVSELCLTFGLSWRESPSVSACYCQTAASLNLRHVAIHGTCSDWWLFHHLSTCDTVLLHQLQAKNIFARSNVIYAQIHTCCYY